MKDNLARRKYEQNVAEKIGGNDGMCLLERDDERRAVQESKISNESERLSLSGLKQPVVQQLVA